ncbi:hypothetical protein TRIATDRAFT_258103 [Trichoderma atroviride IMI 206040]|uniref:Uncharacterized protein n=1 Tax=Hypocrea atroviridis (strain ATCC 20476 / IMI 206040) TaxID=452589 RepID=G9P2D2_HYPAI|nr:uncharacterized protein TRIATDRAFT_258103 [Trichoderma atroviride IMI 206040]EHK42671.1 hypothetical protein TRIATDRAFT_258103 [Trichoderma atroviride IMI 206040]
MPVLYYSRALSIDKSEQLPFRIQLLLPRQVSLQFQLPLLIPKVQNNPALGPVRSQLPDCNTQRNYLV